jgi:predicted ester cyclase
VNDLLELERRYYQALNDRDFDAYDAFFSENVVVEGPGVRLQGLEAMKEFDRGWMTAFPDARITIERQAAGDGVVLSENRITGTHDGVLRGPGGEIPPTGRTLDERYAVVLEAEGGKFTTFRIHYDGLTLLTRLGLMPDAAAV